MNNLFHLHKRMSIFDGLVESILSEGLITSYDIEKLQSYLKKKFHNKINIINPSDEEFQNSNFEYRTYSFIILTSVDITQELEKILNLYGYFIQKIKKGNIIKYQIEPRYPIKINAVLRGKVKYFYHITPTSNLEKIEKFGLAPRGSETNFYHPDDRIYLVYTKKQKQLNDLIKLLAKNKGLKVENFTVLKIYYNDKYRYYLDDMATFKHFNMIAVFVLQNIQPKELEIVNI